jgi:hypothetical protein
MTEDKTWQQMLRGYAELNINALSDDEKIALSRQMFRDADDVATELKSGKIEKELANQIMRAISTHIKALERWRRSI